MWSTLALALVVAPPKSAFGEIVLQNSDCDHRAISEQNPCNAGAIHTGHSCSAYWPDEEVSGTRSALSSAAVYNCLLDTPILPIGMNGVLALSVRRR